MKHRMFGILAAFAAFAIVTPASAEIVCNDEGDCWHAKNRYDYKPEFGLHVYKDDWKWGDHEHTKYRWREHDGRGYWRQGVWIDF